LSKLLPIPRFVARLRGAPRWTIVLLVLTVGSLLIVDLTVQTPERSSLRGEVWGVLEATGTIEERDTFGQFYVSHHNVAPHGEDLDDIKIILTGVTGLVLQDRPEWNGSQVNTTVDVVSGTVEVTIGEGHVAGLLWEVNSVRSYSEFRGEPIPSGNFLDDPEYEIHTTVSESHIRGTLHTDEDLDLSDAMIEIDGVEHYVRKGAINLTGSEPVSVEISCEGSMGGSGYPPRTYDGEWVHIDGRLEIEDFQEISADGTWGRRHGHLVMEGRDIVLTDHGGPSTWEHWGVNLEPWTIGISTDDPGGITSANYNQALVGIILLWGLATILAVAIRARRGDAVDALPGRGPMGPMAVAPEGGYQTPRWTAGEHLGWAHGRRMEAMMGGAICMLNGLLVATMTVSTGEYLQDDLCLFVGVVFPLIGFIGGAFAVMRRSFGMAVVGALATMVSPGFIIRGPICVPFPWIGLLALFLIWRGRHEFSPIRGPPVEVERLQKGWRP
jgi:hypothetical protein